MRALLVVLLLSLSLTSCSDDDGAASADGAAGYGVASSRPSAGPRARPAAEAAADGVVRSYDRATGEAVVTDWEGNDYAVPGEGLEDATYVTLSGLSAPLTSVDDGQGKVEDGDACYPRAEGWVKWFNSEKGYGFISRDGGGDLFTHYSAIQMAGYRTLEAGWGVEFEVTQGPRGDQATDVVVVSKDCASG